MKISLAIDRFEGEDKEVAVLTTGDGRPISFPRDLLPKGSKAGDLLALSITRDLKATRKLEMESLRVNQELDRTDPGGDIQL